jgi:hypothetical protein
MFVTNIICPTSNEWLNGNQVRINAALVCIISILSLWFQNPYLMGILALDFFIRGFLKQPWSFLNLLSSYLVNTFSMDYVKENRAPKKFAAKIGSILSLLSLLFYYINFTTIFNAILIIIIGFSFLESVFKFCAGCIVYTFLIKIKLIK